MIVFGIDAAWTLEKPSGLALLRYEPGGTPVVIAIARSFTEFLSHGAGEPLDWQEKVSVGEPRIGNLLAYAAEIAGQRVDLVTVDMPLSPQPITARRVADNVVTRVYGGRGAGTHSPSAERPGPIADKWFADLVRFGYRWRHSHVETPVFPAFVEVYPHIAIIEMLGLAYRLPYKVGKTYKSDGAQSPAARRATLLGNLRRLRDGLVARIDGLVPLLPSPADVAGYGTAALKGYEDMLDALVSAWVGCEIVAGRAIAYGDDVGAIWGPLPAVRDP